jgi:hypothetical protein
VQLFFFQKKDTCNWNKSFIESHFPRENIIYQYHMDEKSTATHEFHRGKVDGDGSSLYKSFQFVNGTGGTMDNKGLRSMVADYIFNHKYLHLSVLESGTHCKNGEKYCSQIEKHNSWGGEPEIQSLAMHGKK